MNKSISFPRGIEIVGSSIIENTKDEILIVQAPKWHNKWTLPGGHIEPGETIEQALIREGEEETSLKLELIGMVSWGELINSSDFHRPAHFIYFDLYCKVINGEVKLNNELSSFKWVIPEDALNYDLGETFPETISKFIQYKKALRS